MFTATERERVQRRLVEIAESDPHIVAAALVGSLAAGQGDEWSDIDITFGVDESFAIADVIDDWSRTMSDEFNAVTLLDLTVRGTTYCGRWIARNFFAHSTARSAPCSVSRTMFEMLRKEWNLSCARLRWCGDE
jgi:predicted nucleotidyltransferase